MSNPFRSKRGASAEAIQSENHRNLRPDSILAAIKARFGLVGGGPNPSEISGRKREENGPNGAFEGATSPNEQRCQ